jgi:hypothetical protein
VRDFTCEVAHVFVRVRFSERACLHICLRPCVCVHALALVFVYVRVRVRVFAFCVCVSVCVHACVRVGVLSLCLRAGFCYLVRVCECACVSGRVDRVRVWACVFARLYVFVRVGIRVCARAWKTACVWGRAIVGACLFACVCA